MIKRKTGLFSAILLAALLPFCGGKAETSGSSESHFLEPCGAGCKGGFECVCGVCTLPCTAGTACGDLGVASAVCTTGCEESACDVLCDRDADCDPVGDGFACSEGRCRLRPPATRCADAEGALEAFLQGAKACERDDECVNVASDCYAGEHCRAEVALSADHDQAEWGRLSSQLASCRMPGGVACTVCLGEVPAARCSDGTCVLGGGDTPLSCDERVEQAGEIMRTALQGASTACTGNADCVLAGTSSGCFSGCGAIASRQGAESLSQAIETLNSGLCEGFVEDGCPRPEAACQWPGGPVCVDGQCVGDQTILPGTCGDGLCGEGEDEVTCPADCGFCGNGLCESNETAATCPADCTSG